MLLKEIKPLPEDMKLKATQKMSDWDAWEEEIINDMKTGVLDGLISEAKQEYHDGKTEEL
jgi:hypothetical protein